ncbi:shikimate dehydrogenase [Aquabacterium sp. A7-Y]|uniref:shikimate dehydrogenase n=1 Tax=Aquabacterium sp. A7-Y TaxID=1349605 RepID=UPI00223D5CBD|nr:shikimate dehydrogenase [Aquabacterium sp. A7-Y]MCW7538518.1 shikimate dehydrogenase [Aquabacterium sp. A7-Y]
MTLLASQPSSSAPATETAPAYRLGLIGAGISQSRSPALHETEAAAQGISCRYELIDLDQRGVGVEGLADVLGEVEGQGFSGVNITLPCKQAVIPLLHELSPEAQVIGAVNTVRLDAGRRIGYNTDARGFASSFRHGLPGVALQHVLQFGAGGAGAATAFALLELGVRELTIVDVTHERAQALADTLASRFAGQTVRAVQAADTAAASADGIVNSTPLGTRKYPGSAMPLHWLRPEMWVAEVVYAPLETVLLGAARAMGCRTLSGASMLVFQAAGAFELFTGRAAQPDRMMQHFRQLSDA